jgi:hypothetical protein
MRHLTLAAGLAFAIAATVSMGPAKAEFGGPLVNDQGQCRQYGANNQNLTYYHWDKCPTEITRHGHTHAVRTTVGGVSHHHAHHHG